MFTLFSQYFGDFGSGDIERYRVIQNNFTVCGSCRSVMDIRVDVDDPDHENLEKAVRFAYCSTCKRGHKLPRGVLAPNPVFCAICSYQAVTVTKPDGKTHAICPQCFKCVTHSLHTR
jgi:putative hemolysin